MLPTSLPVDGVVEIGPYRAGVHDGDQEQMDADAEVGDGQIAH